MSPNQDLSPSRAYSFFPAVLMVFLAFGISCGIQFAGLLRQDHELRSASSGWPPRRRWSG